MAYPFFFMDAFILTEGLVTLPEETSRHIVQVLRMKAGELVQLTDGKGNIMTASIAEDHKRKCVVKIQDARYKAQRTRKATIAISLVKNANRFEWFLEKATEIGISSIIPMICERTEKQHFRFDRMKNIMVSAMLQSQQVWLPELQEPRAFQDVVSQAGHSRKWIAHCLEGQKEAWAATHAIAEETAIMLIGPEGDFTKEEIDYSIKEGFVPVTLGETRLRTETAGMVAAVLLAV